MNNFVEILNRTKDEFELMCEGIRENTTDCYECCKYNVICDRVYKLLFIVPEKLKKSRDHKCELDIYDMLEYFYLVTKIKLYCKERRECNNCDYCLICKIVLQIYETIDCNHLISCEDCKVKDVCLNTARDIKYIYDKMK